MTRLVLNFVPISGSEHVYLNGLELDRDLWTIEPEGAVITLVGAGELPGDRLECRYAHLGQDSSFDLLFDTFTRADTSAGVLGVADSGQPWLNALGGSDGTHAMRVLGNQCVGGNGVPALAESGLVSANGTYEADLTLQGSGEPSAAIGCMGMIGERARWQFSAHIPGGRWILSYWPDDGVETTADQNLTGPSMSTLYRMKIVVFDRRVRCYANGDLKIDHTMSEVLWEYFGSRTCMLLRSSQTDNVFDNVEVTL